MNIPIETAIAVLSTIVALIAVWISIESNRHAHRTAIREATEVIFREWWSEELRDLRRYFFLEFVPKHRAKLNGKGMKEIEQTIAKDKGRARRLCYFFDRVGWLGAAGLIDVDYVLGPMQHVIRRTWIVMEPLILKERELRADKRFDPVFQLGFDWLFKRTSQANKHQAYLLRNRFLRPRLHSRGELRNLKMQIEDDESAFRSELQRLLAQTQSQESDPHKS